MQAAIPNASSIKINFGQRQPTPTPIDISLTIDLFSPQYQTIRSQLSAKYKGVSLALTCGAFQFQVQGDVKARVEQLQQLAKQLIPSGQQTTISVCPGEGRILVIVETPHLNSTITQLEGMTLHLKQISTKENNQINLNICSHNDAQTIWNRIPEDGLQSSLFNSLHLEFGFVKNELISGFLSVVFDIFAIDRFKSLLNAFKKVNVQLNLESGSYLKQFPKLNMVKDHPPPPEKTPVAQFLLNSGIEKGRFFLLNQTVLVKGNLNADGFITVLKAIHA